MAQQKNEMKVIGVEARLGNLIVKIHAEISRAMKPVQREMDEKIQDMQVKFVVMQSRMDSDTREVQSFAAASTLCRFFAVQKAINHLPRAPRDELQSRIFIVKGWITIDF